MAYYQVLNAPQGTLPYKPGFFEGNVVPVFNMLEQEKRKKAIEGVIEKGGYTPEFSMDKTGDYSVSYKKPEEKKVEKTPLIEQIFSPESVTENIRKRQEAGDPMSVILGQLDEGSRKILGLPSAPPDSALAEIDAYNADKEFAQPIAMRPEFKEGKGLEAFFSKDVANIDNTTRNVLGNIKTLADLRNLLADKEALKRVDVDAIREYFGEDAFNKAMNGR